MEQTRFRVGESLLAKRLCQATILSCLAVTTRCAVAQIVLPGPGDINTIAGTGTAGYSGDGGAATSAKIDNPRQAFVDSAGNVYIVDYSNSRIRKINASTGVISTVVGTGTAGFSGDGGAATSAKINLPTWATLDSSGNIYIADNSNNRIRKVTASTGVISTVAGNGTAGYSGDGSAATSAELNAPSGVAVDAAGNIYIADSSNNRIREVNVATGNISTIAGTGTAGYSGDEGAATSAKLNSPGRVGLDSAGNIYIADTSNNRIREVTASTGVITTVAGNGTAGYSGDGGAATSAKINGPRGIVVDTVGNIYIADASNNRIREVTVSTGIISTFAGNGTAGFSGDGGVATSAELNGPFGVALDSAGNIYITDTSNQRIRAVGLAATSASVSCSFATITYKSSMTCTATVTGSSPTGSISFTANGSYISTCTLSSGSCSSNIMAEYPTVPQPVPFSPGSYAIAGDYSGDDDNASAIGLTSFTVTQATPTISINNLPASASNGSLLDVTYTYSGNGSPTESISSSTPGVCTVSGNVVNLVGLGTCTLTASVTATTDYTAATGSPQSFIVVTATPVVLPSTGDIDTVAGDGNGGYSGDGGEAISAELFNPNGVAIDSSGNIYIADEGNNRIRKVTISTGLISTFAGNGTAGFLGDGGAAASAELNAPNGVAVDNSGNIYIADETNNRIRKVTASTGDISTVAGDGTAGYSGDGSAATSAELKNPEGVALDSAGNIYIADYSNNRIRKVTVSTGKITTVAGDGTAGYSGDGGAATSAELFNPNGVTVDSSGNIYIADKFNNRIRKVTVSTGKISTVAGDGTGGYSGDGGAATSAELFNPAAVALDSAGNIYIADTANYRIREVTASTGNISTFAGNGTYGDAGDGGPATSAEVTEPNGVALDSADNVYIADTYSEKIRVVGGPQTAAPTFSPVAGTYNSTQTVTISDATSGATIYYTTNGTTPTTSSNVYSGQITVSSSETMEAMAVASGYTQSAVASAAYVISLYAATPTFSPAAGTYTSAQTVTISDGISGATIYYTIDGTAPTASSAVYSGPISVFSTETLEAIATAPGYLQSAVGSATYTISGSAPAANPSFFPPGGSYPGTLTAVITDPTPNVVIYYTTDGSTPTTNGNGTQCSNDCMVTMNASTVVKAIATASGYSQSAVSSVSYTLTAPTPIILGISPVAGPIGTSVTVSGENFGDSGTVTFNGTTATPTSWGIDSVTVPVPVGATSGQIVITTNQGTSNGYVFTIGTGISGIAPSAGSAGTSVVISGSGFGSTQGSGVVTFNGIAATPSSWSDTSITAAVPLNATTGNVAVQINGLTATGPVFTLTPSIVSLAPSSGPIGAIVTITGSNFGAVQGGSIVTFGATSATPIQWSPNLIVVPVPAGTVSGSVVVTVAGQSSNSVLFTVGSAVTGTISGTVTQSDGVTPVAGATVTVFQGSNSIATTATAANGTYSIGNLAAVTYSIQANATGFGSGEQSNVTVSAGQATVANLSLSGQRTISYAYDKDGRLTQVADSASGYATYTYDPVGNITSISRSSGSSQLAVLGFSPASGPVGTTLSIVGTGFNTISGNNSVTVGGASASVISGTATQLVVTVPAGATTGTIGVTNSNGSATSSGSFTVTSAGGAGAPSISSFTPTIGAAGATVTISGTGFNTDTALDSVQFNGQIAAVSSATTTSISAAVPAGAVSGPISVQTSGGTAVSSSIFTAIPVGYMQSNVDFSGQLSVGGSYTGTINTAGNIGLVSFTATAGEEINLAGTNVTLNLTKLSILKPDGSPLAQGYVENGVIYSGNVPVSGSYEILITQTSTGSATFVLSTNSAGTIASGTQSNVSINTPGQNADLTFSGTQGQLASIQLSGGTFNGATLSILTPEGGTLLSNSFYNSGFFGPIALPTTGTYTLIITPTNGNTGSISVNLSVFSNQISAISLGVPTGLTLSMPGQTAQLTFTATEGQAVSVSLSNLTICGSGTNLSLLSPDGSIFATSYAGCSSSFVWVTPVLPGTGTYTLVIAPQDGATGSATITVTLLNEPPPTTITPGTSTGLTINTPGQIAQWTFTGTQGQFASVQLSSSSFPGCSALSVSILNPDGSTLTTAYMCGSGNFFVAPVVLPATGTYTLVLAPQNGGTGNVTVLLSLFNEPIGTTISAGTPVGITINTPGQDAQLTFTGTAGQLASAQLSGTGFPDGDLISILGPEGTLLASNYGAFLGPVTLPVTGTYTVVIAPQNGDTGTATVGLSFFNNLNGSALTAGTPATAAITAPGQNAQWTFTGTQGQSASVQLSNVNFPDGVAVSIFNPDGTTLISGSGNSLGPVTLPATGTFTVVVAPQNGDTGSVTVNVSLSTLGVISLNTPATLTVTTAGQPSEAVFSGLLQQLVTVQVSSVSFNVDCSTVAVNLVSPTGTTIGSGNACTGAVFQNPVALPATGFYTLQIVPPASGTGSVTLSIAISQIQSGSLSPGSPTIVTINTPGQNVQLTFTGAQGQLASVLLSNSTFPGGCGSYSASILSPDGSNLASGSICGGGGQNLLLGPLTLPAAGIYTLVLSSRYNETGSTTVLLSFFNEVTGSIAAGTPANITINAPGQGAQLTFTGTAGQWASVQLSGANILTTEYAHSDASLSILNPDGTMLVTGSGAFVGPVTLPVNGTYTLVIVTQSGNTGVVTVDLSLSNGQTSTTISSGTPAGIAINAANDNSQLTFNGTAGQIASVQLQGTSFPDGLLITIVGPDGVTLASNASDPITCFLGPVTLPASGMYTLLFSSFFGPGDAIAHLWLFNNITGTIVPGTPFGVNIDIPGQTAVLSFSGAAGQTASVQLSNVTFTLNLNNIGGDLAVNPGGYVAISILNPDGTMLISNSDSNGSLESPAYGLSPVTLPVTGDYTLVIAPQGPVFRNWSAPAPGSAMVTLALQ